MLSDNNVNNPPLNTTCRLCQLGEESVFHLLSNCSYLAPTAYKKRHDDALKCFFFPLLKLYGFISKTPHWYTWETIKPMYENERVNIYWDIPEYTGNDKETLNTRLKRPDGKICLREEKKIYLVEMSVPWICLRHEKYEYKARKYDDIKSKLKIDHPDYKIEQITIIMDVFGGYENNLSENIEKVINDKIETRRIIRNMQKSIITNEAHIARTFKVKNL